MYKYPKNFPEKKTDEKEKQLKKAALEGAAAETVQRYGSAAKQHYVAYSGIDNEDGKQLSKGLASIAKSKVNPDYQSQNIKQQAGFSAEVKSAARRNAQNIIERKTNNFIRIDDLGRVNDSLYDLAELGSDGKEIPGSNSQMKFMGNTPEDLLTKLNSKQSQKYIDANTFLDIPDDDYNSLMGTNGNMGIIDQKITLLKKQLDTAKRSKNSELIMQKESQITKLEKIKKNIRKSELTRNEAIEARLHPQLSTTKDIIKIAEKSGKKQAEYGAKISGSISLIKNIVACLKEEKTPEEAAKSVVFDTGTGTVISYVSAFSGSTIKGAMQNSASAYIRSMSKSNLPAMLITTTADISKILNKFFEGSISGEQCVEELGEYGIGEISAAIFSVIGINTVPASYPLTISVMGGLIGATLGYASATACYSKLSSALRDAKIARDERIRIEKECKEAIALIKQYRIEMDTLVSKYLTRYLLEFNNGFLEMDKAILENNIDGFIHANSDIQRLLGKEVFFNTQEEFDYIMSSETPFRL